MFQEKELMIFREEYMPWIDDNTPGMDIPDSYFHRESGIHNAVISNDLEKVKEIVSKKPDALHETDYRGENVLHLVAQSDDYIQMALLLMDMGANLHLVSKWQNTPLDLSVYYGSCRIFEAFIKRKATYGELPLLKAAMCGHSHMVKTIIDLGFDPNAVDSQGYTALHYAILSRKNRKDLIMELLNCGSDYSLQVDENGITTKCITEKELESILQEAEYDSDEF
jgi:ankyrin repeat protein